jgi:penicillin-binding protein 1A
MDAQALGQSSFQWKPANGHAHGGGLISLLTGYIFTGAIIALLVCAMPVLTVLTVAGSYLWSLSRDLPDVDQLKRMTLAEMNGQQREFTPISAIPEMVRNAFVAAEDKDFYEHGALDLQGMARALSINQENRATGRKQRLPSHSTITQQVAKNFQLSSEHTFNRQIKEAILAYRIERAVDKSRILELYLNEVYLGRGAYGVTAASRRYFGKELNSLATEEIAYLAMLPKAPNNYDPARNYERALERRNYIIGRMAEDGYISTQEAEAAAARPLTVIASNR